MAEENPGNSDESCMTSHCLKWGPLPANDGRITQHVREGEERKEEKDGEDKEPGS